MSVPAVGCPGCHYPNGASTATSMVCGLRLTLAGEFAAADTGADSPHEGRREAYDAAGPPST